LVLNMKVLFFSGVLDNIDSSSGAQHLARLSNLGRFHFTNHYRDVIVNQYSPVLFF
jgi:hypothetical protein